MRKPALRLRLLFVTAVVAVSASLGAGGAAASSTTLNEVNVVRDFAYSQPACVASETVLLTGTVRHRFRITVTPSGGLHFDHLYAVNGRGHGYDVVTDPGLLTPVASYTASEEQIQSMQMPSSGSSTYNFVQNTRTIRQGRGFPNDNLHLVVRAHVTVNANGVVTVDRAEERLECR